MREWKCTRCQDQINILVPDSERKFVIDGEHIFCGPTCRSAYKQHIPIDPVRKKQNRLKRDNKKKTLKNGKKKEAFYKCFNCENVLSYMTWDKVCPECKKIDGINLNNIKIFKVI